MKTILTALFVSMTSLTFCQDVYGHHNAEHSHDGAVSSVHEGGAAHASTGTECVSHEASIELAHDL